MLQFIFISSEKLYELILVQKIYLKNKFANGKKADSSHTLFSIEYYLQKI